MVANVELWRKLVSSVAKPSPAAELEPGSELGWVKRALTFPPLPLLSTITIQRTSWRGRARGPAGEAGPGSGGGDVQGRLQQQQLGRGWRPARVTCWAQPRTRLPRRLATHGGH